MRSHILPAVLIAALLPAPQAGADTPDDPLRFFATCAGRLSAELSHRWMFSDPGADDIEVLRIALLDIVEMLTPEDGGREVLSWRIQARTAHSALLSRAVFQNDDWASDRAAAEVAYCASFVLGPTPPAPTIAERPGMPPTATAATAP
ncbi:MAG: hypothetical protein AAGA70_13630 [Pseudomonadota bacterium]